MYIKSVKIQGFKSFADKIELDLNAGVSAIVGPNGSGKSNVVDAILWVLGEQSVKQLRGENAMSDVIFAGSKSRDALSKASVAILFDNSDHRLNTELNEVEIKRVIYKTGENEYYINNAKVRLKDITDMLMDVTSKFNIISQGNIAALVENKSQERRTLFESAAGVLKYKKRKEEALKKLEGTKENLTRINLITKELNTTLEPLEKQKEDAEKYLDIKGKLENIEIALLASDITNLSEKYEDIKRKIDLLQIEVNNTSSIKEDELERYKLENVKIDEEISELNKNIIELNDKLSRLNSEKQINLERAKYAVNKESINEDLIKYKENKISIGKDIEVLSNEIKEEKEILRKNTENYNNKSNEELKLRVNISTLNNRIMSLQKEINNIQNKINIENNNLENSSYLPRAVSSVINNVRLKGIHNTILGVIEVNDAHNEAITTALGASSNFIITDDMESAKNAIEYLKEYNLGRATFFPIDTIKSRIIPNDILYSIKEENGFIGIASDLISFNEKYRNIIENQLGNVIVVEKLDDLFNIAKRLEYKYKIVSLDGEVVFPGGSVSGGNQKAFKNDRTLLNTYKADEKNKTLELEGLVKELDIKSMKYEELSNEIKNLSLQIVKDKTILEEKDKKYNILKDDLLLLSSKIEGLSSTNNSEAESLLEKILEEMGDLATNKDLTESKLKILQNKRFELTNKISEIEKNNSLALGNFRKLENEINQNEIEKGKLEVKIDNMLSILSNDYQMTYDNAKNNYVLSLPEDEARTSVNKYKSELKKLPDVNIGAISEYNRLKKRFDFLDKQKNDLDISCSELEKIISETDEIMIDKFKTTFDKISKEFTRVFKEMFKGGSGELKLSDENDLLNTGINILAVPPGKKLSSTSSLSGGEKSLTAICLIFAILSVRPTPFIILDEAEAALDEENVNMFGEYLNNMKKDSQFILITHKKKMMEYADLLYGITMQESGVSKLVSVRLED